MKTKGVGVVLEKEGKFLLQLRDNVEGIKFPNRWGFFGGHLEQGENFLDCAIREIKEEINLDINQNPIRKLHHGIQDNHEFQIFKTELTKDITELKLNEGQDMKLFSKEEIINLNNTVPGIRRLIANL